MTQMSSGGDMALTASLSTAQVEASLARLEGAMAQSAARVNGVLARAGQSFYGMNKLGPAVIAGVTGGMAMARKSLLDYAEKNDFVMYKVNEMGRVWGEVWKNIGRDTASSGVLEYLTEVGRQVDKFQRGTKEKPSGELWGDAGWSTAKSYAWMALGPAGFLPAAFEQGKGAIEAYSAATGDGGATDKAMRDQEALTAAFRNRAAAEVLNLQHGIAMDKARGKKIEALEKEIKLESLLADIEIGKALLERKPDAEIDAMIRAKKLAEAVGTQQVLAARAAEAQEATNRNTTEDARMAEQGVEVLAHYRGVERSVARAEKEAQIAKLRAEGRKGEAEAAALQLQYEERIADVRNDYGLTDGQKEYFERKLRGSLATEMGLIKPEDSRKIVGARGIGAGLATAGLANLVFGSGAKTNDAQRDMLAEQRRATQLLEAIRNNTQNAGATYR